MKYSRILKIILLLIFLVVFWVGCGGSKNSNPSKDDPTKSPSTDNSTSQVTIYVGGTYSDSGLDHLPCYWDYSGVKHNLPADTSYYYEVKSFFVSNNVVYAGGYYYNANNAVACYWDNTGRHDLHVTLPSGVNFSYINSIFVKNSIVYTCGYYKNGTKDIACYWVGSTKQDLESGGYLHAHANSIFVDNLGKVYVGGDIGNGNSISTPNPCYWANSLIPSALPILAGTYATVKLIYNYNGDIYSCGVDHSTNRFFSYYWLNKGIEPLAVPSSSTGHVTSIFTDNNSFYAGGYYSNGSNNVICYWDSKGRHELESTNDSVEKTSISILVKNNTVYVGGIKSGSSGDNTYYWDNTGGHCVYHFPQYRSVGFSPVFMQ